MGVLLAQPKKCHHHGVLLILNQSWIKRQRNPHPIRSVGDWSGRAVGRPPVSHGGSRVNTKTFQSEHHFLRGSREHLHCKTIPDALFSVWRNPIKTLKPRVSKRSEE